MDQLYPSQFSCEETCHVSTASVFDDLDVSFKFGFDDLSPRTSKVERLTVFFMKRPVMPTFDTRS
jgi:hypothetical protein